MSATKAELSMAEVERDIALHRRAMDAWDAAWDRARDADVRAGRPYNRHVYAEAAHKARAKVLGRCERRACVAHRRAA